MKSSCDISDILCFLFLFSCCFSPSKGNIMPEFSPKESSVILKFPEGPQTKVGTVLHKLNGVDIDGDTLTFSLTGDSSSLIEEMLKIKQISKTESHLILENELDREKASELIFTVKVTDGRSENPPTQEIMIIVMDVNDNKPKFENINDTISIPENSAFPQTVGYFKATDSDEGPNSEITYSVNFLDDRDELFFEAETVDNQIELRLIAPLDFETNRKHVIQLFAKDNPISFGQVSKVTDVYITINVLDVNDTPPKFLPVNKTAIPEDIALDSKVVQVLAVDGDTGVNDTGILYELLNEQDKFYVEPYTGIIRTKYQFNMEQTTMTAYKLRVRATEAEKVVASEAGLFAETEVMVQVTDVWGSPRFTNESYVGKVPENSPPGYPVIMQEGYVTEVCDNDMGGRDKIKLTVEGDQDTFDVIPKHGFGQVAFQILVKDSARLDYEKIKEFKFHLVAEDSAGNRTRALITLLITDQNDNLPKFSKSQYLAEISENPKAGLLVAKVTASDVDSGIYGAAGLRYLNLRGLASQELNLDEKSGEITVKDRESRNTTVFDREKYPEIFMTVDVKDNLGDGNGDTAVLVIKLLDENDNSPQFTQIFYEAEVYENQEKISLAARISAFDNDQPYTNNSKINFSLLYNSNQNYFSFSENVGIDPISGVIFLKKSFDFETVFENISKNITKSVSPVKLPLNFTIQASDLGNPPRTTEVPFTLYLIDQNDCAPEFIQLIYNVTVREDANVGEEILKVSALDRDISPGYNTILYKITGGNDAKSFEIDSKTGVVSLAAGHKLDWNLQTTYSFFVGCVDQQNLKCEQRAAVKVTVLDVNNKPPVFIKEIDPNSCVRTDQFPVSYLASVPENSRVGTFVTQLTATDHDSSAVLRYHINYNHKPEYYKDGQRLKETTINLEKCLVIDPLSGVVSMSNYSFDYEMMDKLKVEVGVEDITGELNLPQVTHGVLTINILNVNDIEPSFVKSSYSAVVKENSPVGTVVTTVSAVTDESLEQNEDILYTILNDFEVELPFKIGSKGTIHVAGNIDREVREWYNFTVKATSGELFGTVPVSIKVLDENDNTSVFNDALVDITIEENIQLGTVIGSVHATDNDTGFYGTVTYTIEGNNSDAFAIDSFSGEISVANGLDRESIDRYELVVKASDNFNGNDETSNSVTKSVTVVVTDVNDNLPVFHILHDDGSEVYIGFQKTQYVLLDNFTENYPILSFTITDGDQQGTPNAAVFVSSTMENDEEDIVSLFNLVETESSNGSRIWTLVTSNPLNGSIGNYTVVVEAMDGGIPPNSVDQTVTIFVKPANASDETFDRFRFGQDNFAAVIYPGYLQDTEVFQVPLIADADIIATNIYNVRFSIESDRLEDSSLFLIDPYTGMITVNFNVNEETFARANYTFGVSAFWNSALGNEKSVSAKLTIYNIDSVHFISLKSTLQSMSKTEKRRQSYLLAKNLESLFGLKVIASVAQTNDVKIPTIFKISVICTTTDQVLTKDETHKLFKLASANVLGRVFQRFLIFEQDKYGITEIIDSNKTHVWYKILNFVFGSHERQSFKKYEFVFTDPNTVYLYYSMVITSLLMTAILTSCTLKTMCFFRRVIKWKFNLPDMCLDQGEVLFMGYNELPNEIKKLFVVQLNNVAEIKESNC